MIRVFWHWNRSISLNSEFIITNKNPAFCLSFTPQNSLSLIFLACCFRCKFKISPSMKRLLLIFVANCQLCVLFELKSMRLEFQPNWKFTVWKMSLHEAQSTQFQTCVLSPNICSQYEECENREIQWVTRHRPTTNNTCEANLKSKKKTKIRGQMISPFSSLSLLWDFTCFNYFWNHQATR